MTVVRGAAPERVAARPAALRDDGAVAWPDDLAARYRAAGCWRDRPLGDRLWDWAGKHPDRTALVDGAHRFTCAELAAHADALGVALRAHGLRRGDRIVVQLPNSWEFVALLLACFRSGVAPVLALPAHRHHELDHLLRHSGARLLVVPGIWRGFDHQSMAAGLVARFDAPCGVLVCGTDVATGHLDMRSLLSAPAGRSPLLDAEPPHPDDVALLLLSGGTTGLPKMIGRTHNDYEYNLRRSAEVCGLGPDAVTLVVLPVAHNAVLGCPGVLGTLSCGGRVVLLPSPEPASAFAAVEREGVTDVAVVPAVARRWLEHAGDTAPRLASLRTVVVGGSVVDPSLARRITVVLGARVVQLFGMAEGLLTCTRPDDPDEVILGTQGRPVSPLDELLVVDEHDRPVPAGECGELWTRGPYTLRGYYRAPEHNARAFTADGWFRTGDLVRLRLDGNMTVEGRRKDLVNRGGEKVSAEEVENLARALLPVRDAAVVPLPDPQSGERVCLVLVPAAGVPPPGLVEVRARFVEHGVALYKVPEQVEVMAELPLTAIGKIDKKVVRAHLTQEST